MSNHILNAGPKAGVRYTQYGELPGLELDPKQLEADIVWKLDKVENEA